MLYQFLIDEREKILAATRRKAVALSDNRPTSEESERGLPRFYNRLIVELRRESQGLPKRGNRKHGAMSTLKYGRELSRLGYTVSQVVHGYGVLCQAITETAESEHAEITAGEFSVLNLCLDLAIAEAVTGFTKDAHLEDVDSAERMGFLVHELRNALAAAIVAHSMVEKGVVGTGGSTNALLKRNLNRMRDILDRSFSEVRMHNEKAVGRDFVRLMDIVEEVEATAGEEARAKDMTIEVEVESALTIVGDRNYLISAVSNLVQNAIKYSRPGEAVIVRSRTTDKSVILEVEDRCGGLPKGKAEELFKPHVQKGADRSGLGLGLTISRQAVALNGGVLSVRDLPGKGCIFSISLPKNGSPRSVAAGS